MMKDKEVLSVQNPGFGGIIGHEEVVRYLRKAAAEHRVSHAMLITGEEGAGRKTIANALAMSLVCENPKTDPEFDACGVCSACRKAMSGNHPDIIRVSRSKPTVISVDDIREQVVSTAEILPYESRYKIYIIPEAEKMNEQAQNALLKTIEEPPEYVVILLLSTGPEAMLPTVLSRCVKLPLLAVEDRKTEAYLEREFSLPPYEAKLAAAFSQGNIGRARRAAADETFLARRDKVLGLVKKIHGMNTAAMSEAIKSMKEEKDAVTEILDLMLLWYRDVLYFKAAADIDGLIFSNEISAIRAQAAASSYEGLTEIIDAADRCRVRLKANVNFELALELFLLTIKENCNA